MESHWWNRPGLREIHTCIDWPNQPCFACCEGNVEDYQKACGVPEAERGTVDYAPPTAEELRAKFKARYGEEPRAAMVEAMIERDIEQHSAECCRNLSQTSRR